jgi:hypothetical protein
MKVKLYKTNFFYCFQVTYSVTVEFRRFTRAVLNNAVAVVLDSITASSFLENSFTAFKGAVDSVFNNNMEPFIFSLKAT